MKIEKKTMEAEERARKLLLSWGFVEPPNEPDGEALNEPNQEALDELAAEIRAAEAEARKAALEEAAKIADEWKQRALDDMATLPEDTRYLRHVNTLRSCKALLESLAIEIRALAPVDTSEPASPDTGGDDG